MSGEGGGGQGQAGGLGAYGLNPGPSQVGVSTQAGIDCAPVGQVHSSLTGGLFLHQKLNRFQRF